MSLYDLPQFNIRKIRKEKIFKDKTFEFLVFVIFFSFLFGFLGGIVSSSYFYQKMVIEPSERGTDTSPSKITEKEPLSEFSQEKAIVKAVKETSPSVVSIIITKELPIIEEYWVSPFEDFFGGPLDFKIPQYREKGKKKQEVGGGTGFIVSEDGLILTNRHVVSDLEADYTVLTNEGQKFPAKVLARDPVQDLAIIKIEGAKKFKPIKFGNSSDLEIGQTVVAIGNALGEFRNTVSVGVISGLGRTVEATDNGTIETLEDVIQTDAAINRGNSGGPLLNLRGQVIGINTAIAQAAENIGFAIPIDKAKRDIEQVKKFSKISYPFLGVRYILINDQVKEKNNLPVDYGAWVIRGDNLNELSVTSGSAAEKAGIQENDIILEFNNEKITTESSLGKIIQKYNPGDKVSLKILRNGKEKILEAVLGERNE